MIRTGSLVIAILFVAMLSQCADAQTSYPMITHVLPLAVERGKTSEVTVHGTQNFFGAAGVYVHGEGVKAEIIQPEKPKDGKTPDRVSNVKLKVDVAARAILGPRELRIATAQGVSSIGMLVVTDHPVVPETGSHPTFDRAQPIELGRMVTGVIAGREEVDMYKLSAKAGQRAAFSVQSARLMHKIHNMPTHFDPIVSVYDSTGREIASNDDYYYADSMVAYQFEKAGEYFVSVRDVRYDGDNKWSYALLATDRPLVTAVYPLALACRGSREAEVLAFGMSPQKISLPIGADAQCGPTVVQLSIGGAPTNAFTVELTDLPVVLETEPNNELSKANTSTLPAGLNGRMDQTNDVDAYSFALKKGDMVRFEVKARRYGSELDSNLELFDAKGSRVAAGDDFKNNKDSVLTYTAAADSVYTLYLRDLLYRGGPNYVYFLEARYDEPDFELVCDDDKAGIPPGVAQPWFVQATRTGGFAGPIEVSVDGLPAGVTVNKLTIPPSMTQGCLVLSAAADAKPEFGAVKVIGRAQATGRDGKPRNLERQARPICEIYVPGGGRGTFEVESQLVQISPKADLSAVRVKPAKLSLKPGEKVEIDIEVARTEAYKGRITLDTRLQHLGRIFGDPLPPGVKMVDAGSKTSLAPTETKGRIVLQADPAAKAIADVPIAVIAHVSIDFVVKRPYASEPILVSVAEAAKPVDATAKK